MEKEGKRDYGTADTETRQRRHKDKWKTDRHRDKTKKTQRQVENRQTQRQDKEDTKTSGKQTDTEEEDIYIICK